MAHMPEVCHVCGAPSPLTCPGCDLISYCSNSHLSLDTTRHAAACKTYTNYLAILNQLTLEYSSEPCPQEPDYRAIYRSTHEAFSHNDYDWNLHASEEYPQIFAASVTVLHCLLEINTIRAARKAMVLAADFGHAFHNTDLTNLFVMAAILRTGYDEVCWRYTLNPAKGECLRKGTQVETVAGVSQNRGLSTDEIWGVICDTRLPPIVEKQGGILGEMKLDIPMIVSGCHEWGVVMTILYLRWRSDLISLRNFRLLEKYLERKVTYDVKEMIWPYILETEMFHTARRNKRLPGANECRVLIRAAGRRAKYCLRDTGLRDGLDFWKNVLEIWSEDRDVRMSRRNLSHLSEVEEGNEDWTFVQYIDSVDWATDIFELPFKETPGAWEWLQSMSWQEQSRN